MHQLPPGQRAISTFPRFGLPQFASRVVAADQAVRIEIGGAVEQEVEITADTLSNLPRVEQISDFHCVTTWSKVGLQWSGYRLLDLYEQIIQPLAIPDSAAQYLLFRCLDGYKIPIMLCDLLTSDVLLADRLDGKALDSAHGTPIRLVSPQQYGYKNPKHIKRIEVWVDPPPEHPSRFRFINHPRARVAYEERGQKLPGWLLRHVYRPLIGTTIRRFARFEEGVVSP